MTQLRVKTLLLTDSGTIDRMIFSGLGETRYDIQSIKSKDETFFQKILDSQPALIFLKSELTYARGIEICDRIKGHEVLKNTKIVFLSSSPDVREQAIQHRADRFLSLPFTLQDISIAANILMAKKPTVLYVDDSDMMHHAVAPHLRDEGYEVLEAWDGQEALELIDKAGGKVDLILSDVEMPVMDGFQLCKNVHLSLSEDIPFVLLTSLDTEEAILRGFEIGADDYILKPVVIPELLSRIKRLLSSKKLCGVARTERILVVDDSEVILKMIIKALNAQGFHVDSAEHGLAALTKLREKEYHLLVTDLEMPHMDGMELCQRIRNGETGTPKLPILFATTRTSQTDIVRMRSIGAQAVIAKPFSPERVAAEVERVLTGNHLERKYQLICHLFPEQISILDTGQDFQDPSFADDQFRTILSTRIVNLSALSRKLKSKEVVELINQYLECMTEILEQSGLAVEKQVEDRIFVSFSGEEAEVMRAVRIAMAMMEAMPSLREKTGHPIQMGAAIHAGHVILGNIENQSLGRQITLFGESVQIARSIRDSIREEEIIVSDACLKLVQSLVEVEEAGSVEVLEKDDFISIFRLKALKEAP